MAFHGIERFQAVAGDAKHGRIISRDSAAGNEFFSDANGYASGGFSKDTLGFSKQLNTFANLFISHVIRGRSGSLKTFNA